MNGPVLHVSRLSRRFGSVVALGPVDLELKPGERIALVGRNGAGKSTLLRCIAGTVSPSEGSVTVCGHAAGSLTAKSAIGVSFSQERSFYLRMSGIQNLLTFARLRLSRTAATDAVRRIIVELQLDEIAQKRVDRCSTGMVQQLAIARALLHDPALLLLDEPTRSLDEEATERLWSALERRPHLVVIFATHRREDVERCGHAVRLGPAA